MAGDPADLKILRSRARAAEFQRHRDDGGVRELPPAGEDRVQPDGVQEALLLQGDVERGCLLRRLANQSSRDREQAPHLDDQDRLHQGRSRQHPLLASAEGRGGVPPAGRVRQRRRTPQILHPQRFRGRLPAEGTRRAPPPPPRSSRRRYASPLILSSLSARRTCHIIAEFLNFKCFPAEERIILMNPPFADPGLHTDPLARERAAAACRDEAALSQPSSSKRRPEDAGSNPPFGH
ncbi:hypothetical protein KSP40_PGU004517 [Platanthera guangdongensis]|uniref:Uncharacterized protein n=1 Tax=Platanthera guangdongensis TaxID=2320717 RepID=A0ABR2MMQ5_9ASPA